MRHNNTTHRQTIFNPFRLVPAVASDSGDDSVTQGCTMAGGRDRSALGLQTGYRPVDGPLRVSADGPAPAMGAGSAIGSVLVFTCTHVTDDNQ